MIRFAFFSWDPKPEVFTVPFLQVPVLWYGLFFAVGFMLGFPIFVRIVERFFLQRPAFELREILGNINVPWLREAAQKGKEAVLQALNEWLANPQEVIEAELSDKKTFFASCSMHAQQALRRLKLEQPFPKAILSLHKQAVHLTDRLTVYLVIATVLGARIGHYVFYEQPSEYLSHPLEIIGVWRMRGLASHGAAIGIVLALGLFAHRYRAKLRSLSWLHLLDFVCVPTALAGALIRLGNFWNQEILGIPTSVPWGVVFGHPADGSYPTPRHPVQLYEALAYAAVFFVLWRLSFRSKYLLTKGLLLGWFLVLVFGARFVVEFFKEEQSQIMPVFWDLTMGQLLSLPAVLIGGVLITKRQTWQRLRRL